MCTLIIWVHLEGGIGGIFYEITLQNMDLYLFKGLPQSEFYPPFSQ